MTIHDYAMYTAEGNTMVSAVVEAAINMGRDFDYVMSKLEVLAEAEAYAEATDTAVREEVYAVMVKARLH
jgi:hypothetical protein